MFGYETKLALHSCSNCAEEVVPERCQFYISDYREYVRGKEPETLCVRKGATNGHASLLHGRV
jgi:hypothetical protein